MSNVVTQNLANYKFGPYDCLFSQIIIINTLKLIRFVMKLVKQNLKQQQRALLNSFDGYRVEVCESEKALSYNSGLKRNIW